MNTDGSYECTCKPGHFINSTGDCVDVDECADVHNLVCHEITEKCINTIGSFECECNDGFFLEHMVVFGQVITGRGRQKRFTPRFKKNNESLLQSFQNFKKSIPIKIPNFKNLPLADPKIFEIQSYFKFKFRDIYFYFNPKNFKKSILFPIPKF